MFTMSTKRSLVPRLTQNANMYLLLRGLGTRLEFPLHGAWYVGSGNETSQILTLYSICSPLTTPEEWGLGLILYL